MLIFNTQGFLNRFRHIHLNTSHVNLQQIMEKPRVSGSKNLNTSHVNLQRELDLTNTALENDLNTSHVNLQRLMHHELGGFRNKFKYISC